ncbi:MAG: hypothetical protein M1503_04705 [Thaumarchaeota archaeon]|nr:hypothetical protein [Nitrososphaerota archaeon]MCL5317551.1 hypothetical protein [Nitrososphaerota archaeon]
MPSSDGEESPPRVSIHWRLSKKKKICPKCLNELKVASSLGGWLLPQEYVCGSCGYRGSVALERD